MLWLVKHQNNCSSAQQLFLQCFALFYFLKEYFKEKKTFTVAYRWCFFFANLAKVLRNILIAFWEHDEKVHGFVFWVFNTAKRGAIKYRSALGQVFPSPSCREPRLKIKIQEIVACVRSHSFKCKNVDTP